MFQHLNHDNRWPQTRRWGLEVDETTGDLTLRKLPGPPRSVGHVPGVRSAVAVASGIAIDRDENIYVSDTLGHRVWALDALGSPFPLQCFGERAGPEICELRWPRGLAYQACRHRLLVADYGNRRIQVVDLGNGRVVDVWGQTSPNDPSRPCGREGGLDGPEHLACDPSGNVYLIDRLEKHHARVVKLDRDGRTADDGLRGWRFDCGLDDPLHIACAPFPSLEDVCVFVLAASPKLSPSAGSVRLHIFSLSGKRLIEPLELLAPEPDLPSSTPFGAVSHGVLSAYRQARSSDTDDGRSLLAGPATAFAVLDSTAVIAIASDPPRVWCFAIGEAISAGRPDRVEPSWLPLYEGPVAAVGVRDGVPRASDHADMMLCSGAGRELYSLRKRGAFRTQGAFLAGPLRGSRDMPTHWNRLRFDGRSDQAANIQWFSLSRRSAPGRPPRPRLDSVPNWYRIETQPDFWEHLGFEAKQEMPPETSNYDVFVPRRPHSDDLQSGSSDRTPSGMWYAFPPNHFEGLLRNASGTQHEPSDELWIFGLISANGRTSPVFRQARVEHDEEGWMADLPEVFQRHPASRRFLESLLALLQSRFGDIERCIEFLPSLFSPPAMTAQYGCGSAELDWLRKALALPPAWQGGADETKRKRHDELFSSGGEWLARRGTPEGLRKLIALSTGIEVVIDEPALLREGLFSFPESSAGPNAGEMDAGNALLMGHSTFPDPEHPALRDVDPVAFHFVVRGYASDLADDSAYRRLEATVEELAPAHLTYSIQIIEPLARVGIQARLGVDAVVATARSANDGSGDLPYVQPLPQPPVLGAAYAGLDTPLQ